MIKYAKVSNLETGLCEIALGDGIEYYKSIGMVEKDVEKSEVDGLWYLTEKCPHYSIEEQAQKARNVRIAEIKTELTELDTKRIRAMCEPSVYNETTGETWLDYYNNQAQALRSELNELEESA